MPRVSTSVAPPESALRTGWDGKIRDTTRTTGTKRGWGRMGKTSAQDDLPTPARVRQASWVLPLCSALYNLLVLMTRESLDGASWLFRFWDSLVVHHAGLAALIGSKSGAGRRTPNTFTATGCVASCG